MIDSITRVREGRSLVFVLLGMMAFAGSLMAQAQPVRFEDVTEKLGLKSLLKGWEYGHGASWGDVDNDGRPDLYFGTFASRDMWTGPDAPIPNMLLLNKLSGFVLSEEPEIRLTGRRDRTSGVLFVDLDNDGDLELIVSNHTNHTGDDGSLLFENLGGGKFRNATPKDPNVEGFQATARRRERKAAPGQGGKKGEAKKSDAKKGEVRKTEPKAAPLVPPPPQPLIWPSVISTRNVVAVDLNNDGLLDLIFCDGTYRENPYNPRWRLIALLNKGKLQFEDVSEKYGFTPVPEGLNATEQGLAQGDVNEDGIPDFFVAGSNRLFVSSKDGKYREAQPGFFTRPDKQKENEAMPCGAAFGDLNGDGLLDLITTVHNQPSRIHTYLNKGVKNGDPEYVQISKEAGIGEDFPSKGIDGAPVKNTHVAIRDVDNDGRMDILLGLIWKNEQDQVQPLVLRNQGTNANGIPTFSRPPDDRIIGYYAPAPVADYDGDGRVDIFMCPWFKEDQAPGYLFRNVTEGGHWLTVQVTGKGKGLNPMGIGSIVRVYQAGHAGDPKFLLARQDIAIGTGYSSGDEALAYFGLGGNTTCDVEVSWAGRKLVQKSVKADQRLSLTVDAGQ